MDESPIRLVAEIFTTIIITGLGVQELLKRWQSYAQKVSEKKLDHELDQESRGLSWITQQADHYRQQVDDLQKYYREQMEILQQEKFAAIQMDTRTIMDEMMPCKAILEELLANRKNSTDLLQEVLATNRTQNDALKLIISRMRFDKNKSDTSGEVAHLMDILGSVQNRREKIQTGEWQIHPPPVDMGE
jgi:hypothetical protein